MKKKKLSKMVERYREDADLAERRARGLAADVARLKAEVETMRENWRPVPIAHQWVPRDPQCALCDDVRDHPRHQGQA